jgi:hypothetical protein
VPLRPLGGLLHHDLHKGSVPRLLALDRFAFFVAVVLFGIGSALK